MGESRKHADDHTSSPAMRGEDILHLQAHALDQISQGILITDADRLVLYANKGFESLTGYSSTELLGKNCSLLQGPDTDPSTLELLKKSLHAGTGFRGEILNYRKDGKPFWNELSISPIHDSNGNLIRFIGTQLDITARKTAETALLESEQRFKHVAKATADALWDWNLESNTLWWNEGLKKLFGFSPEELESGIESWINRIHPEDHERVLRDIHAVLDGPSDSWQDEYRFLCKDGSYSHVLDRGFVMRNSEGKALRMLGGMTDLTEKRLAVERALQNNELIKIASQVARLGAWQIEYPGPKIIWSEEVYHIHEVGPEYIPDMETALNFFPPQSRQLLENAIRSEQPYDLELEFVTAKGNRLWVRSTSSIELQDGRIKRIYGIFQDITHQKQQEELALQDFEIQSRIVQILQEITTNNLSLNSVLGLVTERSMALCKADGAVIALIEKNDMVYRATSGILSDQKGLHFNYHGSFSGLAAQHGKVFLCENAETDSRVDQAACKALGVRSLLIAPLRSGTQVIGVLKIVSVLPHTFSQKDTNNLQILVESLGAYIQRHRGEEQLKQSEAQYRLLFQHNPHPMWAYDTETLQFLAVNAAAVAHYGYTESDFLQMTLRDIRPPEELTGFDQLIAGLSDEGTTTRCWRHRKKDGTILDVEISSNRIDFNGKPARLALCHDITERVRAENELRRVHRAQQLLSNCSEALIRSEDEESLLKEICRIAVEIGGYRMAWVGYARADAEYEIKPMAHAGEEAGYLAEIKLSWSEKDPGGLGPAGKTIRTGKATLCEDITQDSLFHWRGQALARGYRGVICLPLKQGNNTYGLLGLYSSEILAVGEDEVRLLQELADDLAYGIESLRSHQERQQVQAAILKVATSISAVSGTEFFKQLVHNMTDTFGAHAGFVSRLLGGEPASARTLAGMVDGLFQDHTTYLLQGTPCEDVRAGKLCVFPKNLQKQFPKDLMLVELEAQSYVGTPLTDSKGQTIGLLAVLFSRPLENADFIVSMLQIFATRAAAEMERQLADARVREQAALLDKARDAILVRTLDHTITFWNKSAERVYGWTTEEALGRPVTELLYKETDAYLEAFEHTVSKGEWIGEIKQLDRAGNHLIIEGRWTLLRDETGEPQSILAINTDITEKKRLEQQFLRNQRLESIGTLAGGIAHDLNNVLTPILMCVDILRMSRSEKQREEMLNTISSSARRGADMVSQVLSFARGVEGKQIEIKSLHLINDVEKIIRETFPKNIRIENLVSQDLWTILGDPTQLHQVLLNLCVNARDAMPNGGSLTICAENIELDAQYTAMNIEAKNGPHITLRVEDTGTGIPQDIIDKIFDPFFTTKDLGHGTGLGLSTSLSIIKSHRGFIRVYSEPGKGSRFSIYLPACTPAGQKTDVPESETLPRGSGQTVLLVDDETQILTITRQTLEAFGYTVISAKDGAEAVALYAENPGIQVVLMDMMMPLMDGPTTIQVLMKMNPSVKIIATSGIPTNKSVAEAIGSAVRHFLPKPYTSEALLKVLNDVLNHSGENT